MKKKPSFILTIILFVYPALQAQTDNQSSTSSKQIKKNEIPFEKVYLHLDRPYYSAGDDIWFKAYLVNALTNELFDNSNNLNVELISPYSKIIKRNTLRLDKGLGCGDFHLGDSIPSGNYQIRAYTDWMRNFGDVFFFKKEIVIDNQIKKNISNQPKLENTQNKIDIQFFPEGGPLIENVYTRLGFKAINSNGYGCNVKGIILSSFGDSVTNFASTHLGMGSFNFIAKKGLKYFAEGNGENGVSFKVELPTAIKTGYSIKVSEASKDNIHVTIKTNQETLDQFPFRKLFIVGAIHNTLSVTAKVNVRTALQTVILPKKMFNEGINKISLIDTSGISFCERLYYVHTKENYCINIIPDKKNYAPREKVTLQIAIKDSSNKPVIANLSLAVVDGDQVNDFEKKSDINSYLLLESEIRGHIEQPFYYFDTTIVERYNALDNLLLTQGWRNFVWKYLSDTTIRLDYPIEKGITISGKLRRLLVNKPIANANISMALFGNTEPSMLLSKTDSTGKYYFEGLNFTGSHPLIISATNKNNRSQGWISLDSIFRNPAEVKYNGVYQPEKITKEISNFTVQAEKKYNILKKYHLTDTIQLNEVLVISKKTEKKADDGHFRIYGDPDFSLTVTDQMSSYNDIFQLLQGRVAGFQISGVYPNISFSMRGSHATPLFLLDGMPVEIDFISNIPVSEVDKIEVLKDAVNLSMFGSRGGAGVISIFTKNGFVSATSRPVYHSVNQKINGYYQARTFYSPKYTTPLPEHEKPDLRTTIYWEPNIVTDANGNATVSFFNADNNSIIKADLEGISESGFPIVGKLNYEVQQNHGN
jgi:hypothetical protein